jgi:Na+-transporting methylmalonyl-CoA/oxaloacetate decarboxylase gamma subunit
MTLPTALLAISLPDNPVFADNLQFQITGLLVVIFTLGVLAMLVAIIGRFFTAIAQRQKRITASAPSTVGIPGATPSSSAEDGIPAPVFAVIAAAVSTALGDRRFVIQGVQAADPRASLAWSAEGRRSIYASKNLR